MQSEEHEGGARSELAADSPLMRALSQCESLAVLLVEADGCVRWADQTAQRLLTPEGVDFSTGQKVAGLFVDAVEEDGSVSRIGIDLEDLAKAGSGGMPPRTVGLQVSDYMRWVEVQAQFSGSEVLSVFLYDVTIRVEIEHGRLRDVARTDYSTHLQSMGDMAAGIADDFNNLLLNILGKTGLMLMDMPADSVWREGLQAIEGDALQAGELSNQMLAWAGRIRPVTEPLNLSLLIERMDYLLQAAMPPGAALHRNCDTRIPLVQADAVQLRQLILGLMSNAADALMDQQGVITITTGCMRIDEAFLHDSLCGAEVKPGRYVCFEVSDNGAGIPDEIKHRVFDPFFTTKDSGRGLGLAAALGVVRGHNGVIRLESSLGKGTTVTVLLPVLEGTPAIEEKPANDVRVRAAEGQSTVLVVEEDDNVRQIAGRVLARFGWQTALAARGSDAIDMLDRNANVSVALIDLTISDYGIDELIRNLRQKAPDIRVLLTSGYLEREEVQRLQREGLADGYVQKPYTPIALMARIREASGRS